MKMHNPPHPGEIIKSLWLDELKISARQLASYLNVAPSTITRLINGKADVSADMACRLSKVLGRSPESWLAMQSNFNIWQIEQKNNFSSLRKIEFNQIKQAA